MAEFIEHFGVNGKLFLAQVVNFILLLYVLRRFAYKPILRVLKVRREEIEKGLRYTDEAEEKLKKVFQEKEIILQETRREALNMVNDAEDIGKSRKEEIIKEAENKSEAIIQTARKSIEEEKAKMRDEVYRDAEEFLAMGVMKVLGKMSPEERDKILIREALKELRSERA
ncbi:MAG TPA: F0F1 ATP synthase subunit B [Candidatus Paceibacterota bacterium]